jgi:hypothetical protein
VNRAERRAREREQRAALQRVDRGDPWARKLLDEGLLLSAVGVLDELGELHCRECGATLQRNDGWHLDLRCSCGWRLADEEVAFA